MIISGPLNTLWRDPSDFCGIMLSLLSATSSSSWLLLRLNDRDSAHSLLFFAHFDCFKRSHLLSFGGSGLATEVLGAALQGGGRSVKPLEAAKIMKMKCLPQL